MMKKCPKCKAEIGEEARFCLYCMTSFEEKQTIETPKENDKRWLYIIAAVLALVLIALSIFFFAPKNRSNVINNASVDSFVNSDFEAFIDSFSITSKEQQNSMLENTETSSSKVLTHSDEKGKDNTTNNSSNDTSSNKASSNKATIKDKSNSSYNSSSTNTTTNNASTSINSQNNTNKSSANTSSSSSSKTNNNNSKNSSTTNTTTPATTPVIYSYRDAQYGDDFSTKTNVENCVVITGVETASANGKYSIPETIDGKKVIAIMEFAFTDSAIRDSVKKVIIPASVKTINTNAFISCLNMTDIYFCGDAIYCYTRSLPHDNDKYQKTFTVHCSAECTDRNYRTYKSYITNYLNNTLGDYSILYDEWYYED